MICSLNPLFNVTVFKHCEHISFYASNRLHITALENKKQTIVIILLFIPNKISGIAIYDSRHTIWGMHDRDFSAVVATTYFYITKLPKPLF